MTPRRDPSATASRRPRHGRTRAGAVATVLATAAMLAGCAADAPRPGRSDAPTVSAPAAPSASATASVAPSEPAEGSTALVPDGTAADNLALFTEVAERVWASDRRAEGRAYVDALVAAGFDKAAMQVTEDLSTVGNPAESLQFSVLWGDECLVGQVGPDIGEAVTRVLPALEEGTMCLVGETRPIDW
ncbi:hypothetical protein [Microbacterium sp. MEC084]|uniref:DUF6993 domain-containing protein n=1 Tax=Microbacterium sp. MEC084 TaxID=1963027 RepID=UPI001E2F574C|nr:hypothetical protein [Microbacterium sp. MEC084]